MCPYCSCVYLFLEEEYGNKQVPLSVDTSSTSGATSPLASPKGNVFKRPGDPISLESPAVKRARYLFLLMCGLQLFLFLILLYKLKVLCELVSFL